MREQMTRTHDVIDSYKVFLEIKYRTHYQIYCRRLKENIEAAKAEAVMFSLLRNTIDQITLAEDVGTGGVDFLCVSDQNRFIVEVTSLEAESVAIQSGWPNEIADGTTGWFGMVTHMLRTKASSKASQLSGYAMPRVLAITSEHMAADVLLGPHGADALLTSDTKIKVPIGKPIDKAGVATDLKDSVFFRFNKEGQIEPWRKSISAIILVTIFADRSLVVGVLHPEPAYQFPITLLPSVPFLRLSEWPPKNNALETEWVIAKPRPGDFLHQQVIIKDAELRTI
jgi:hypothetical protein